MNLETDEIDELVKEIETLHKENSSRHIEGFEKEAAYSMIFDFLYGKSQYKFKARPFRAAIKYLFPEYEKDLFEPRKCIRKLQYLGEDENMTKGFIYESKMFNGACYVVENDKGNDEWIGYENFEVVEETDTSEKALKQNDR